MSLQRKVNRRRSRRRSRRLARRLAALPLTTRPGQGRAGRMPPVLNDHDAVSGEPRIPGVCAETQYTGLLNRPISFTPGDSETNAQGRFSAAIRRPDCVLASSDADLKHGEKIVWNQDLALKS